MAEPDVSVTDDVLGAPYTAETLPLRPDDEGEVVATLVHRPPRDESPTSKAVLHVHGFADYFFQTGLADFWVARGYDFYALDLRKYGRSLRPHQTPNYVADLRAYYEELDLAYAPDHRGARPRRVLRALDRRAHRAAVAARPRAAGGRGLPERAVDRHARRRVHPAAGAAGDPPARGARPDAADPARGQRRLRAQPAPRPPRRVGLQPRLEAAGVLAGVRRLDPRDPHRPGADRPWAGRSSAAAAGQLRPVRPPDVGRGPRPDVHRRGARRRSDAPAGARALAARDHRAGARRDPRRGPLPRAGAHARCTTSWSAGSRRTSTDRPATSR